MNTTISYRELARRVGDCILNNEIRSQLEGEDFNFELFNGDTSYCYIHESEEECRKHEEDCRQESRDIYQDYIITKDGAEYLQRKTNEIVFYCDKLDLYIWVITHFGTSWSGVFTSIKE